MVFSSLLFLFLFLPTTLLLYYLCPRRGRNAVLLFASLLFYLWGEGVYVLLMLLSIALNFTAGLLLARTPLSQGAARKWKLGLSVAINLTLLVWFKYANFLADNLNLAFGWLNLPTIQIEPVHLPIGISFFTFQALSYVVDVYRLETPVQKNPLNLALYVTLFPQLIAGPIVRYHDVATQLEERRESFSLFASGISRFIIGLAKKVLLANVLGELADTHISSDPAQLSTANAWLGLICYSFQIYFDFSGYSDMAIGLGQMFGFRFLENFNYPYIAGSIQEFWRRWHISLSTWFRDYLYIPLGGNRAGSVRVYFNLVLVFFLCGLWHGASWNFVIWGLIHGTFLVLERLGLGKRLARTWAPLRHLYVLAVVLFGWVFFRLETLAGAGQFLKVLLHLSPAVPTVAFQLGPRLVLTLVLAVFASTPMTRKLWTWEGSGRTRSLEFGLHLLRSLALMAILVLCVMYLAAGTYNPFIYFRF